MPSDLAALQRRCRHLYQAAHFLLEYDPGPGESAHAHRWRSAILLTPPRGTTIQVGDIGGWVFDVDGARLAGLAPGVAMDSSAEGRALAAAVDAIPQPATLCTGLPLQRSALLINELRLSVPYRGLGLGLLAVRAHVGHFSRRCPLAVFRAWMYTRQNTQLPGGADARDVPNAKLMRHFSRLGFVGVGTADHLMLDARLPLPGRDQLMPAWAAAGNDAPQPLPAPPPGAQLPAWARGPGAAIAAHP